MRARGRVQAVWVEFGLLIRWMLLPLTSSHTCTAEVLFLQRIDILACDNVCLQRAGAGISATSATCGKLDEFARRHSDRLLAISKLHFVYVRFAKKICPFRADRHQ